MSLILILAALPEEAEALFPGEGTRTSLSDIPVRRMFSHGHRLTIATCGMGKVNAALTAGLLIAAERPDALWMTGCCGRVGALTGEAFWISEAVQHDYGSRLASGFTAYRAGDWPIGPAGEAHFAAMPDPGLGLPHARIASGDSFVGCPGHGGWLAETLGAHLVDMEVGALAQVADRTGLPWAAIKAVTDDADAASANDFHNNLVRAARAAAQAVERGMALLR
jgi:adenosylhomocysteine nucleosidase